MKFQNSDVLLSYMSFRVLQGILRREKEFNWLSKEVASAYNRIQKVIDIGSKKEWSESKIRKEISTIAFSEPYVGLLFIDKQISSINEAIEESYNYFKSAYLIYVKRSPNTPEFNIYRYLKYVEGSDLYNTSNYELRKAIHKYNNPEYNGGNIEKSTLVVTSYLSKYYKNYYL